MSDDRLRTEINNLERKVKLLLAEHHKLRDDLTFYRNENEKLKSQVNRKETEMQGFQNRFKIVKLVENMMDGGDGSAELKDVLDNYIKEIDKCIAHLSEA